MADLNAILEGKFEDEPQAPEATEAETPQAQPEPEQEAAEAAPEPEATDEPKGDNEDAPPASEDDAQKVPYQALKAEREKRQRLEQRLRELEQAEKGQKSEGEAPDPLEDPKGWEKKQQERLEQQILNERFNTSEMFARQQYGEREIDEAVEAFKELAAKDATLAAKMRANPHPYGFVMETVKKERMLSEIGSDPVAYREKLKAEILAELQQQKPPATEKPQAPPSLAKQPSASKREPEWTGPPDLDAIVNTGF